MTILFLEGFEKHGTSGSPSTSLPRYWTTDAPSYPTLNGSGVTLTSGRYGGSAISCALWNDGSSDVSGQIYQKVSASLAYAWTVGFAFKCSSSHIGSPYYAPFVKFLASNGQPLLQVCTDQMTCPNLTFYKDTGTTAWTSGSGLTTSGKLNVGGWNHMRVSFVQHSSTGSIQVNLNGQSFYSFSGNTNNSAGSTNPFTYVQFLNYGDRNKSSLLLSNNQVSFSVYTAPVLFDDIYMTDGSGIANDHTSTIKTLLPTSDQAQAWTKSTGSTGYSLVDDAPSNDTDYISSTTTGVSDNYYVTTLSSGGANDINTSSLHCVAVNAVIKNNGTFQSVVPQVRPSGYPASDLAGWSPTNVYAGYQRISEIQPNSTLAWTKADINSGSFGVKT